jgi:hypothetical protein
LRTNGGATLCRGFCGLRGKPIGNAFDDADLNFDVLSLPSGIAKATADRLQQDRYGDSLVAMVREVGELGAEVEALKKFFFCAVVKYVSHGPLHWG